LNGCGKNEEKRRVGLALGQKEKSEELAKSS
jgi:hypothetical protein